MAWNLIVDDKKNQDYEGPAEKCVYTFNLGPDQIPGTAWAARQIINAHVEELADQNSQLLELRVWEDTTPTWQTNYYVEVVATASPLFWNLIIGGVLAILFVIAIYFTIKEIKNITQYIGDNVSPVTTNIALILGIGVVAIVGIVLWRRI